MEPTTAERQRLVRVARGLEPAGLVIRNAHVVDVFTLEVREADVAICGAWIAGIGSPNQQYDGLETIDANGGFLAPGLIDGHVHLESAMLSPRRFAEVVVPMGTVGVIAEPHEIVNVIGVRGLEWTLLAGRTSGMHIWASVPSCVPASEYESAGATMNAEDVARALKLEGVLGLAEMMNYPGVLNANPDVWAILEASRGANGHGRIDGHAAGLSGSEFTAYAAAGIHSDHEAVTEAEALERIRAGVWLMAREGPVSRNLAALAPLLERLKPHRAMVVTDDNDPGSLLEDGHLDRVLREAVKLGINPAYAIRLASLSTAEYWKLEHRGAIAPGYAADLVLFADLQDFRARWTMIEGRIVAKDGKLLEPGTPAPLEGLSGTVKLPAEWGADKLKMTNPKPLPVIGIYRDQVHTDTLEAETLTEADPSRDIIKLAVIERHTGSGRTGIAFAKGFGLQRGAYGQTVNHDAHNIILAGANDDDMVMVARELERMGGGAVVVENGVVLARLALPIAGLVSDAPASEVVRDLRALEAATRELGCVLPHPTMTLGFLGLTVIPSLKITDRGLFDVVAWKLLNDAASKV
jgi:adenine deaminase